MFRCQMRTAEGISDEEWWTWDSEEDIGDGAGPPVLSEEELREADKEADRVEIERLQRPNFAGGAVLIPVCEKGNLDGETRYMSATIVRDWRKREEGGVSKWYRRSRMVARDFKAQDPTRSGLCSPAKSKCAESSFISCS